MLLQRGLRGLGVLEARREEDPEDVPPRPRRDPGDPTRWRPCSAEGSESRSPQRCERPGTPGTRAPRRDHEPIRRPFQAFGPPLLREGDALRVLPELGDRKLPDLYQPDLQEFVDGLLAAGFNPSTIQVTLNPLRAIYRRRSTRRDRGEPMPRARLTGGQGPPRSVTDVGGGRSPDRSPPGRDRALWATAMYAGLRRGELRALRVGRRRPRERRDPRRARMG